MPADSEMRVVAVVLTNGRLQLVVLALDSLVGLVLVLWRCLLWRCLLLRALVLILVKLDW